MVLIRRGLIVVLLASGMSFTSAAQAETGKLLRDGQTVNIEFDSVPPANSPLVKAWVSFVKGLMKLQVLSALPSYSNTRPQNCASKESATTAH